MIAIENLSKKYGEINAVNSISLTVSKNEILALVGPSGCGKSTLLRLIAGLDRPDSGNITIDGTIVSTPSLTVPPRDRKLALIFQDLALWPHLSVYKHLEFVIKKEKYSKDLLRSKINDVLQDVNLDGYNKRYPHQLSGGEKQRLAIARAIISRPQYLLMDEPFSNLDPLLKDELGEVILKLKNNRHMGIIYVTHNIEEVYMLADNMGVILQGKIVQSGTKEVVLNNPKDQFVARLVKAKTGY